MPTGLIGSGRAMSEAGGQVALVGFMGAGKTTVGRLLAAGLGLDFVDLDDAIATRAGMSIPEIFAREGEQGFRRREKAVLTEVSGRPQILATGGGVVKDPDNVRLLRAGGRVVWLQASPQAILARVGEGQGRPLLAGRGDLPGEVARLLGQREPLYREAADLVVDTSGLAPGRIAARIAAWYKRDGGGAHLYRTIPVPLPGREYPIQIGPGALWDIGPALVSQGRTGRVLVVTNPTVARWYLSPLCDSLAEAGFAVYTAEVPDGEDHKSLAQAELLYNQAIAAGLDRADTVVALGGGVIGDLAGFVAATYLRGLAFVQAPTTILAQIDSSIGGKVAVNLPAGKNLVGAFHQPVLVLADTVTLRTLPERELRAGLVEMLKHSLLDADYFAWYERNLGQMLAGSSAALVEGIAWSCRIKAGIVVADEREHGPRTLLNLGHTVGHALEQAAGYGRWRHGEAVGLGLLAAARLSKRIGLPAGEAARLEAAVRATLGGGLPRVARDRIDAVIEAMARDKKNLRGKLRFVLLEKIGRAAVDETVTPALVREEIMALADS